MPAPPTFTTPYRILAIDRAEDFRNRLLAVGEVADRLYHLEVRESQVIAREAIRQSIREHVPFSVVMASTGEAPRYEGLARIEKLWECDSDLQVIAYSDGDEAAWEYFREHASQPHKLMVIAHLPAAAEFKRLTLSLCDRHKAILVNRALLFEKAAQLQEAQESLRLKNRHLELASRMARVGYGSMDLVTQKIQLSDNACRILDVANGNQIAVSDILATLPKTDRIKFQLLLDEAIYRERDFEYRFNFTNAEGNTRYILMQITCERDANSAKSTLFIVVRDVTQDETVLKAVRHASLHDTLTGLPNRAKFNGQLEAALKQSMRSSTGTGLILLDLDRFKEVNDSLGHPVGDGLLKQFSERLRSCVRESDTVARLGGDEFAIVQTLASLPRDSLSLLERIYEVVSEPYQIHDQTLYTTFSAGVALAPINGRDVDTLLKNADLALYRAKQDGRGVYRFFDAEMDQKLRERLQIEADLKHALHRNEFELQYQPIVCSNNRSIAAMETLVRWIHPARGRVRPDEFIEIAESTAAIVPIGEWILQRACEDAQAWPESVTVAINVSAVQLKHGGFFETVRDVLGTTGLSPCRLEIEITETVFLTNSDDTRRTLNAIRGLGVKIAMDDFGTGYSSLSYLRNFPFDKIKLDKSFLDKHDEAESRAIISAVAGMGESLGMLTCAEGVETEHQFRVVKEEGYTHVQGYLFGKPSPQNETLKLFQAAEGLESAGFGRCNPG